MTLAGGAVFGLVTGTIVVSFASTIGATLACIVSRYLLQDWVQSSFGEKLATINEALAKEGAFYLFTMRLIPAFPFFLINLAMGLGELSKVAGSDGVRVDLVAHLEERYRIAPERQLRALAGVSMGGYGALILGGLTVSTLLWARLDNPFVWIVLGVTLTFGLIGFADDIRKIRSGDNYAGLSGRMRLLLETLIALVAWLIAMAAIWKKDALRQHPARRWFVVGASVVVGARVSKAGDVQAKPGDFEGTSPVLSLAGGSQAVSVTIDQIVP